MSQPNSESLSWSDAWLLASILWSRKDDGSFSLANVIGAGDALNHAIFIYEEIDDGLGKLISEGYILFSNGIFLITDKAFQLIEKLQKIKGGLFTKIDSVSKLIGAAPYNLNDKQVETHCEKYVSRDDYRKAIDEYKSWVTKTIHK